MSSRFYVDNFRSLSFDERDKFRKKFVCAECGEYVSFFFETGGRVYLACHRHNFNKHEGVAKEFVPPDERKAIGREEAMNTELVTINQELARRNLPVTGILPDEKTAIEVCRVYWPKAPDINVKAAAYLCRDYGLHPGMNHVYLVPYAEKDKDGNVTGYRWEMMTSIGAKRLIAHKVKGVHYSYIDGTPRLMSEEEEKKIYGSVNKSKVRGIVKLRTAEQYPVECMGAGEIDVNAKIKGADKGNSLANMAQVRAEARALDRLPGNAMPNVQVSTDENLEAGMETPDENLETVEGEFTEYKDEKVENVEAEVITSSSDEAEAEVIKPELEPEPEKEKPKPKSKKEPEKYDAAALKQAMDFYGVGLKDVGAMVAKKGWKADKLGDLNEEQVKELIDDMKKAVVGNEAESETEASQTELKLG